MNFCRMENGFQYQSKRTVKNGVALVAVALRWLVIGWLNGLTAKEYAIF